MGRRSGLPQGGKRILVVDDDTSVAEGLRLLLAQDHRVEVAHSGAQALAVLLARPAGFDAILCDLMMPGMSGAELYRQMEDSDPGTGARLIFMTGGAFTSGARRFLDAVDNLQLQKPFDVEAIERVLSQAFSRVV